MYIVKINHTTYKLSLVRDSLIILYEDNVVCISQIKGEYIKCDIMKYISQKFFYTHKLKKDREIDFQQICLNDNMINLFTKALPNATIEKLVDKHWNVTD